MADTEREKVEKEIRRELAKAAMTGILATDRYNVTTPEGRRYIIAHSVELADALLLELDKK